MPRRKNLTVLVVISAAAIGGVLASGKVGLFGHSSAIAAEEPAVETDTTGSYLTLAPPPSALAKQGLDELWAIRQKGDPRPTDCPGITVWSERYMEALQTEKLPKDKLVAALKAHADFMLAYSNSVIQSGTASAPAITDARYGFGRAVDTLREVNQRK